MTSAQIRAARALLGRTVRDLAEKAGGHRNTVTRAESDEIGPGYAADAIRAALEVAGVEFIDENGGGPGVRLRKGARPMPISYDVPPRTILLGNYSKGGFQPPEMVKRRPALVASARLRHRTGLLTVVPPSTSEPDRACDYHCKIAINQPLPKFPATELWVKADMLAPVAFERLDLFHTERDRYEKRKHLQPRISEADFEPVRACVRAALGL